MSVKITISLEEKSRRMLIALARKHKRSVSDLVNEWIVKEKKREKLIPQEKGLGSFLSTDEDILKENTDTNYKALLGEILEEKLNKEG